MFITGKSVDFSEVITGWNKNRNKQNSGANDVFKIFKEVSSLQTTVVG